MNKTLKLATACTTLALLASACQTAGVSSQQYDPSQFQPIAKDIRLFDAKQRMKDLARIDRSKRIEICPVIEPDIRMLSDGKITQKTVVLTGGLRTRESTAMNFINAIAPMVSTHLSNPTPASTQELEKIFNTAIDAQALIEISHYAVHAGYAEPGYDQAITLNHIAYWYEVMKDSGSSPEFLNRMKAWGNQMYATGRYHEQAVTRAPDLKSATAASWMSWGVATGSQDAFDAGYKHFQSTIRNIEADGHFSPFVTGKYAQHVPSGGNLRYTNMVTGYAVMAAHAAERLGMPGFELKNDKGKTLRDAVRWLLNSAENEDYTSSSPNNQDLRWAYKNSSPGAMSLSWAEIYRAHFPNDPVNKLITFFLEDVNTYQYAQAGIYGAHYGGYTSCFFKSVK